MQPLGCKGPTPAVRRLVQGGYLTPPFERDRWMPDPATLDRPVTADEASKAVASVVLRIQEKKTAVDRPDALKEGDRPETR